MNDLIKRANVYKKNIEPELEEEIITELPNDEDDDILIDDIRGFCIDCEAEGKYIGNEGDDWTCLDCLIKNETKQRVYKIKTYILKGGRIEYNGLYEDADDCWQWDNEEDARIEFEGAIEMNEFKVVELIMFNPNIIDEWGEKDDVIDEWEDEYFENELE